MCDSVCLKTVDGETNDIPLQRRLVVVSLAAWHTDTGAFGLPVLGLANNVNARSSGGVKQIAYRPSRKSNEHTRTYAE